MKRIASFLALAAMAAMLLTATGCQKKVDVQSGTRVVCTYGEPVSNDVKTVSVPADKVSAYRVVTKTLTCERHTKLEALYAAAQADIASGDLVAAKAKLTQVIQSDSAFAQARQQLNTLAEGGKPKPDTASGGQTGSKPAPTAPKPGDEKPTGPTVSLLKWAPDAVTGFSASTPIVDTMSFSRQYVPSSGSRIVSLVIVAEQFRSPAVAKAALAQAESQYPRGASRLTVNGRQVYFGTDGRRFSVLAFAQGSVLVQAEMSAEPGQQATLKDPLVAVAKQMP